MSKHTIKIQINLSSKLRYVFLLFVMLLKNEPKLNVTIVVY